MVTDYIEQRGEADFRAVFMKGYTGDVQPTKTFLLIHKIYHSKDLSIWYHRVASDRIFRAMIDFTELEIDRMRTHFNNLEPGKSSCDYSLQALYENLCFYQLGVLGKVLHIRNLKGDEERIAVPSFQSYLSWNWQKKELLPNILYVPAISDHTGGLCIFLSDTAEGNQLTMLKHSILVPTSVELGPIIDAVYSCRNQALASVRLVTITPPGRAILQHPELKRTGGIPMDNIPILVKTMEIYFTELSQ
jgi:hypothetical protein